jgi:putative redox protein
MGVRPMEMLLLGLGGCSSFDVMSILTKARQAVSDCRVELEAERAEGVPSPFTKIHMQFIVTGKDLKDAQVKRAVELSATKYCSASIMLEAAGVVITHGYEVRTAE